MINNIYINEINNFYFIENMIEEQNSMIDFINSNIGINNEAASIDKIKNLFSRLKTFFTNIWQKFLEKLKEWTNTNKKYLEDNKDIILNKPITLNSVTMTDHFTGMKNIDSVIKNTSKFAVAPDMAVFDGIYDSLNNKDENKNKYINLQYEDLFKNTIGSGKLKLDDNSNIAQELTSYFNGSPEEEQFNTNQIQTNIQNIYDSLYNYSDTFNNLSKLKDSYIKAMDQAEKNFNLGYEKIKRLINSKNNNTSDKPTSDSNDSKIDKELNNLKSKTESYLFINEEDQNSNQNDKSKTEPDTRQKQDSKDSDSPKPAKVKMDNDTAKYAGAKAAANTNKEGNDNINSFQALSIEYIKAFSNTRTTMFGAVLNGLTSMRNDYMIIIKAHVDSYKNKPTEDNNDNKTEDNPNV